MTVSNQQTVIAHVRTLGRASRVELEPLCPEMDRLQLAKALAKAAEAGFLRKIKGARRAGGGKLVPVYEATDKQLKRRLAVRVAGQGERAMDRPLPPRGQYGHMGRLSSVFDLAQLA